MAAASAVDVTEEGAVHEVRMQLCELDLHASMALAGWMDVVPVARMAMGERRNACFSASRRDGKDAAYLS